MTKNNKFHIPDKKGMDEIIKIGVEMDIPDVKDVVTDEDLLAAGYSLPPADLLEKTKKRIEEEKRASKKVVSFRKIGKRIGIAVAVFMLVFALSLTVKSVRVYVFGIVNRITDNAIKFHGTSDSPYTYDTDEKHSYDDAEEAMGEELLKPTYLPKEFIFDQVKIYANSHVIFVYQRGEDKIRLYQYLMGEGMNIESIVHTDIGSSYTLNAHNSKIQISQHKQMDTDYLWLKAIWNNDTLLYKVEGNCSKEEFEKFIVNLK